MEILYIITALLFITHPEASAEAAVLASSAMKNVVLRSLFPMMVLSRLISSSRLAEKLCSKIANFRIWRLLNLSDCLLPTVLTGFISGLPASAKEIGDFLQNGLVSEKEAEKALALSCLPSPAFVILVASSNAIEGAVRYFLLLTTAYLTVLFIKSKSSVGSASKAPVALGTAVSSAASSAIFVGANIAFFSALICLIASVFPKAKLLAAALFEMGSGVIFANGSPYFISLALGWRGLSAMQQIKGEAKKVSLVIYIRVAFFSVIVLLLFQLLQDFLQNVL